MCVYMPTKPHALPSATIESTNYLFLPCRSTSLTFKHSSGRGLSMRKPTSHWMLWACRKVLHPSSPTLKRKMTIKSKIEMN